MDPTSNDERVAELANALADGVDAALPSWVEASVETILVAYAGAADDQVMARARAAGDACRADIGGRVRHLLQTDVDQQWTNPMAIVRDAVRYPTGVLRDAGVPPVVRDESAERLFPTDDYDLTPAKFADLDESLHDPSLAWGAAKAFVVKARHGGRRQ